MNCLNIIVCVIAIAVAAGCIGLCIYLAWQEWNAPPRKTWMDYEMEWIDKQYRLHLERARQRKKLIDQL